MYIAALNLGRRKGLSGAATPLGQQCAAETAAAAGVAASRRASSNQLSVNKSAGGQTEERR